MSWLELSFLSDKSTAERCSEHLEALGAVSVSFLDAGDDPVLEPLPGTTPLWHKIKVVGLFEENTNIEALQAKLSLLLPNTIFQVSPLAEQDWTRAWLKHFQPLCFAEKLWVIPSGFPPPEDPAAVVLTLDPGLAFGTGTHPTTALCLNWLANNPPCDQMVIDYGCGSGILAIAALKLQAQQVWAIDYDPQAITATLENRRRNALLAEKLHAHLPTELDPSIQADTLLANILAEPLIELAPKLQGYCQVGGNIVLAGLLKKQMASVCKAYEPWFTLEVVDSDADWILLWGKKQNR